MRRLRRGVDNDAGPDLFNHSDDFRPVADVDLMVHILRKRALQPRLIPPRIALFAKKLGSLVVVDAMHLIAGLGEPRANLRANQAGRTRY